MKIDKLYKHKKNTEVAFNPTYILEGDIGLYMEGEWYNIVYGVPKLITTDAITVKKDDVDQWELYEE